MGGLATRTISRQCHLLFRLRYGPQVLALFSLHSGPQPNRVLCTFPFCCAIHTIGARCLEGILHTPKQKLHKKNTLPHKLPRLFIPKIEHFAFWASWDLFSSCLGGPRRAVRGPLKACELPRGEPFPRLGSSPFPLPRAHAPPQTPNPAPAAPRPPRPLAAWLYIAAAPSAPSVPQQRHLCEHARAHTHTGP